jgi:predicted ATP-binding protein involved in virulence
MKRIKQISVKNLFGMFDHTISLNMDERITIIHGPNGFGKTAILRLLDSLFSQDNSALEGIPFDEFRVQFEDNTDIWVNKAIEMSEMSEEYRNNFDEPPPYIIIHFFDPAHLSSVGLLGQIDKNIKDVLAVYTQYAGNKLYIFDELANKIDLLKRIINKRFLYKEMTISKERGFIFTNAKDVVLSPDDLSSGERHELILFYELLFKVAPGSLILIEEPEISLHVVWQEQFLEDVLAVTRLSDIDVLLATHSPDIVGGRRDLMVELKGA